MVKKEILIGIFLSITALGYCVYLHLSKPKIGYVNLVRVYEEFKFKKEKEKNLLQYENENKRVLDSLKLNIEKIKRSYSSGINKSDTLISDYKINMQQYNIKNNDFEAMKDELVQKYDSEIWKHLNQYIEDYSKKNSYDFMFGANGNGTVMYANPGYDITEDVTRYVNERYDGKK